jgi:hypothetical protein
MHSRSIRNLLTTLLIFFVHERCACHVMADDVAKYGREITGDELISTLERIAKQVRRNQESIQTWKGKCEYEIPIITPTETILRLPKTEEVRSIRNFSSPKKLARALFSVDEC